MQSQPVCATRCRLGAGYLTLSDADLADGSALGGFLPVMQEMGQLEIEVVDAQREIDTAD